MFWDHKGLDVLFFFRVTLEYLFKTHVFTMNICCSIKLIYLQIIQTAIEYSA